MQVYFKSSFWDRGRGLPGTKQPVYWQFEYAGAERHIPAIYRFANGLIFDVLTILDEAKVYAFLEKYESRAGELTALERRLAEQEHPYQDVPIKEIWINSKRVDGDYSSSTVISMPGREECDELALIRHAYRRVLQDRRCFACERFAVPYPEADSRVQALLRCLRLDKVRSLRLVTRPVSRILPLDLTLALKATEEQIECKFVHPESGVGHALHLQRAGDLELPIGDTKLFITQALYSLDPGLPDGETLQFDSTMQVHKFPIGKEYLPHSAASIGIIGTADGPTSVFIGGQDQSQAGQHRCFSIPSLQKEEIARFKLEGINCRYRASQEFAFSLREPGQ